MVLKNIAEKTELLYINASIESSKSEEPGGLSVKNTQSIVASLEEQLASFKETDNLFRTADDMQSVVGGG